MNDSSELSINSSYTKIKTQIDESLFLSKNGNTFDLQNSLNHLYMNFNQRGSGSLIIDLPNKIKLGECFVLMLQYDWTGDKDIREVWAENAFFCIIGDYTTNMETSTNLTLLFKLLHYENGGLDSIIKNTRHLKIQPEILRNYLNLFALQLLKLLNHQTELPKSFMEEYVNIINKEDFDYKKFGKTSHDILEIYYQIQKTLSIW
tara:strand:- start:1263 stop:1874 length:612 start_codon:yes stop_codon:yes gene_type:complete